MSVLIRGMKMPKICFDCELSYDYMCCMATGANFWTDQFNGIDPAEERMPNCPLIEIPYHGDLVDIDKMLDDFSELRDYDFASREYVVIHAERKEE